MYNTMKKNVLYIGLILLAVSCSEIGRKNKMAEDVTLASLLEEMTDREAIARFPSPDYTQSQVSSYDRRSIAKGQPGWFANNDGAGYVRMDSSAGRKEKVLFDETGPGAITRIWMTTNDKRGKMRFYFDGEKDPSFVIPAYDMRRIPFDVPEGLSLTHTHYVSDINGVGGNTFFLPLPYSKSCKITLEEPDSEFRPRYYQINYRTYRTGTKVRTFTVQEYDSLKSIVSAVSGGLCHPADAVGKLKEEESLIGAGSEVSFDLPAGPGQVSQVTFSLKADSIAIEKLLVKAVFDGEETVDVPIGHLAGAGIGMPKVSCWWTACDGVGTVTLRFPMPYRKTGKLILVNDSNSVIDAKIAVVTNDFIWDSNAMYFHVSYRAEEGIPEDNGRNSEDGLIDWNLATLQGRGKLVGTLLSVNNHTPAWYGEGDEKIYVDGESFPSHFGTGTEDYFNCSWAPVVTFYTPWGGAPRADEETSHGYNAFFRTRILDDIPFKKSLVFDIEMISWEKGVSDYYATTFWYGDAGAKAIDI